MDLQTHNMLCEYQNATSKHSTMTRQNNHLLAIKSRPSVFGAVDETELGLSAHSRRSPNKYSGSLAYKYKRSVDPNASGLWIDQQVEAFPGNT